VPELGLLPHLPALLGGLLGMLADPAREIRVAAHACLLEFLVQLQAAAAAADWPALAATLVEAAAAADEFTRLTVRRLCATGARHALHPLHPPARLSSPASPLCAALLHANPHHHNRPARQALRWLREFVSLAPGPLAPQFADALGVLLPNVSHASRDIAQARRLLLLPRRRRREGNAAAAAAAAEAAAPAMTRTPQPSSLPYP